MFDDLSHTYDTCTYTRYTLDTTTTTTAAASKVAPPPPPPPPLLLPLQLLLLLSAAAALTLSCACCSSVLLCSSLAQRCRVVNVDSYTRLYLFNDFRTVSHMICLFYMDCTRILYVYCICPGGDIFRLILGCFRIYFCTFLANTAERTPE